MKIDFLARQRYYLPHLAPVWNALPNEFRGKFWINPEFADEANALLSRPNLYAYVEKGECGSGPLLACAYGDAAAAVEYSSARPIMLMEHGVGLTFGKASYADGLGRRDKMGLFLVPNSYVTGRAHPEVAHLPHPVVGMPKLDSWAGEFNMKRAIPNKPVVAIAFHHGSKMSRPAEVGSAWEHYYEFLPKLAKRYRLITHVHPLMPLLGDRFKALGLEFVEDFGNVMRLADVYLNDASSTAYEFLVTGKPVVLLNAPWFDRKVKWGIRFWDYSDIGPQVDYPEQLFSAIDQEIEHPERNRSSRSRAVSDLFPYLGRSAERVVEEMSSFLRLKISAPSKASAPAVSKTEKILSVNKIKEVAVSKSKDLGVVYMCFGGAAEGKMAASIHSLRNSGSRLPIAVVSDSKMSDDMFEHTLLKWDGECPFDGDKPGNFQFRAGRVKPFLYGLTPFKRTLYVDCDTEFLVNPESGFNVLNNWDFAIAHERLLVCELYNQRRAGWYHNLEERDATIAEFGDGNLHFWNSGVFFFKKNKAAAGLFKLWYEEWLRWQQWDEQLALMRAANRSGARVLVLGEVWNFPHREGSRIIYHEYGRGTARTNLKENIK